jgi:hypothetical protein
MSVSFWTHAAVFQHLSQPTPLALPLMSCVVSTPACYCCPLAFTYLLLPHC